MLKKEEKRDDDVCVYNGIVAGVVGMLSFGLLFCYCYIIGSVDDVNGR